MCGLQKRKQKWNERETSYSILFYSIPLYSTLFYSLPRTGENTVPVKSHCKEEGSVVLRRVFDPFDALKHRLHIVEALQVSIQGPIRQRSTSTVPILFSCIRARVGVIPVVVGHGWVIRRHTPTHRIILVKLVNLLRLRRFVPMLPQTRGGTFVKDLAMCHAAVATLFEVLNNRYNESSSQCTCAQIYSSIYLRQCFYVLQRRVPKVRSNCDDLWSVRTATGEQHGPAWCTQRLLHVRSAENKSIIGQFLEVWRMHVVVAVWETTEGWSKRNVHSAHLQGDISGRMSSDAIIRKLWYLLMAPMFKEANERIMWEVCQSWLIC